MMKFHDLLRTSFRELEIVLFQELAAQYLEVMQQILMTLDELLWAERDSQRWVVKERRGRQLETLFGTLQYKRRYYQDRETGAYVALLDEALGIAKQTKLSPGLTEAAIWQGVNGPSYRAAQRTLEAFYHRPVISHETVRQRVLEAGQLILREEQRRQQTVQGERQVPILFIEVDGLYTHLQREKTGGVEQRLALSHEGWQPRLENGAEYELMNRHYYMASQGEDFWEAASRQIYSRYDLEGTVVVINGDRADWIKRGTDYFANATVLFQWDRFHIKRELRRLLKQPGSRKRALRAFQQSKPAALLVALTTAEEQEADPERKEEIRALKEAVSAHPEAFRDYRIRLKERGLHFKGLRGLGAAKANMDRFANRLKKRGQNWGRYGLQAITAALAKHLEGRLRPYAQQVARLRKQLEALPQLVPGSAGLARQVVAQVYLPRQGGLPATALGRHQSGGLSHFLNRLSRPGIELA